MLVFNNGILSYMTTQKKIRMKVNNYVHVLKFNEALTGNNSKSIDNMLMKLYDRTIDFSRYCDLLFAFIID